MAVQPNTAYLLVADTATMANGGNLVGGELAYFSSSASSSFGTTGGTTNFTFSGTAVTGTPEPASTLPALVGVLVIVRLARCRQMIR